MSYIKLKFSGISNPVILDFEDNINAQHLLQVISNHSPVPNSVILRGRSGFDSLVKEFIPMVEKANQAYNLNWNVSNFNQLIFNAWHRDIENFDIAQFPNDTGELMIRLHALMHRVENAFNDPTNKNDTAGRIFVQWYADPFPYIEEPQIITEDKLQAGDVVAIYPHVGKSPHVCMMHNENSNLEKFCKLSNMSISGFEILLRDGFSPARVQSDIEKLKVWYNNNVEVLSKMFSEETMLKYHGSYKLGQVRDASQIELLKHLSIAEAVVDDILV
jgi:hypothetical protein